VTPYILVTSIMKCCGETYQLVKLFGVGDVLQPMPCDVHVGNFDFAVLW
jgi:hypothetical protein